ncbi:MAG: hypothetical protein KDC92_17195 [Bacteroidetes bacterium]|nr:hypothetical protein [Bacteroidota bacterium]
MNEQNQECQKEKQEVTLELYFLRQEMRTMTIHVQNNYHHRYVRNQNSGKRARMLLDRCRTDLDFLAQFYIRTADQAVSILNRRFEYVLEDEDEDQQPSLDYLWNSLGEQNTRRN